jgi:hypothetical protein
MQIIIIHGTTVTAAKHPYAPDKTGKPPPAFIPEIKKGVKPALHSLSNSNLT